MSMTQLLFDTAHVFDGSVDAMDGEMTEARADKIFELPIESTVLFSPVTAYTKVSEASVTVYFVELLRMRRWLSFGSTRRSSSF
eukprot:1123037-Pleurochrysis_carterae.AAC.1